MGDIGEIGADSHLSRRSREEIGEIGENSRRPHRRRRKMGDVGEYLGSARSVTTRNMRFRRFVFCRLRNVLGRMGLRLRGRAPQVALYRECVDV